MIGSSSHVSSVDGVVALSIGTVRCNVSTVIADVAMSVGKCSTVAAGYALALSMLYSLYDIILVLTAGALSVTVATPRRAVILE